MAAQSIEFRISEPTDTGGRVEFGRWEGRFDVIADGEVAYSQPYWNVDEFALSLKSWLEGGVDQYEYDSIDNLGEPVLWVRRLGERWVLGSDLNEGAKPQPIVELSSLSVFRVAAHAYWTWTVERFPEVLRAYREQVAQ